MTGAVPYLDPAPLTLANVATWPVALVAVVLYPMFRFVGDPPYAGAEASAYLASLILPGLILAVLLVAFSLAARLAHFHASGIPVIALTFLTALIAQAVVTPSGSVAAEARASAPLITVVTEAMLMTILWTLTAIAAVAVSTYLAQVRALRARERALEAELASLDVRAADERERIIDQIAGIAEGTLEGLRDQRAEDISAALRSWSEDRVRALSRDIADSGNQATPLPEDPPSPWVTATQAVTRRDPIPVVLVGVVALAASPGLLFRLYPPATALLTLGAVVAFSVLGAQTINMLTRPLLPHVRVPTRMAILYAICIPFNLVELMIFSLPRYLGGGEPQAEQGISALWIGTLIAPILTLLMVWLRVVYAASDARLTIAQTRARDLAIQVAVRNLQMRQRRDAWARALHGGVQSSMIAASIRLDRQSRQGPLDEAAISQACKPVLQALEEAKEASVQAPSWSEGVTRLHALWDGIIDLRIDLDPAAEHTLENMTLCRSGVIDVLTEAVSNAVRHGHAGLVSVLVEPGIDATLLITVTDDGTPVDHARPQGLGSALLDDVSVSWTLTRQGDSNVLTVELPAIAMPDQSPRDPPLNAVESLPSATGP